MKNVNKSEERLINILENAKQYVKGELELDCFGGIWIAMDYRADLESAFSIEAKDFNDRIISVEEAKNLNIDVRKCCDECGISYVG